MAKPRSDDARIERVTTVLYRLLVDMRERADADQTLAARVLLIDAADKLVEARKKLIGARLLDADIPAQMRDFERSRKAED